MKFDVYDTYASGEGNRSMASEAIMTNKYTRTCIICGVTA